MGNAREVCLQSFKLFLKQSKCCEMANSTPKKDLFLNLTKWFYGPHLTKLQLKLKIIHQHQVVASR